MNNSTKTEPIVYSVKQVSQILHTNPKFVYELINLGLLPALKLRSIRVRKESLDEFLRTYEGKDLSNLYDIKPLCAY